MSFYLVWEVVFSKSGVAPQNFEISRRKGILVILPLYDNKRKIFQFRGSCIILFGQRGSFSNFRGWAENFEISHRKGIL